MISAPWGSAKQLFMCLNCKRNRKANNKLEKEL